MRFGENLLIGVTQGEGTLNCEKNDLGIDWFPLFIKLDTSIMLITTGTVLVSSLLQVENPTQAIAHAPERVYISLQQPLVGFHQLFCEISFAIDNDKKSHY